MGELKPGDVVNGRVWTGTDWLELHQVDDPDASGGPESAGDTSTGDTAAGMSPGDEAAAPVPDLPPTVPPVPPPAAPSSAAPPSAAAPPAAPPPAAMPPGGTPPSGPPPGSAPSGSPPSGAAAVPPAYVGPTTITPTPLPAQPRSGPPQWIWAVVGVAVLVILVAAGAWWLTHRAGPFDAAVNTCRTQVPGYPWTQNATIEDGGQTLSMEGVGEDDGGTAQVIAGFDASQCILTELNTPARITSQIGQTRALDGMQTASADGLNYVWNYHPDHGLALTISTG